MKPPALSSPGVPPANEGLQPGRPRRSYRLALLLVVLAALGGLVYLRFWPGRVTPPEVRLWPVAVFSIAGNGTPGRADGYASAALFSDPFGVAVDALGNTFVTDAGDNNMVRRIAATGEVTAVAGGREEGWKDGHGAEASFNTPSGIALAPDGTLVVADTGNHAIRRVTPGGVVTTVAGGTGPGHVDGAAAAAKFDAPIGVAVGADGRIFVADTYNDCIRTISPEGTVATLAGGLQRGYRDGEDLEVRFDTPSGIAIDGAGTLFVADTGNNLVRRIDGRGLVTTLGTQLAAGGLPSRNIGSARAPSSWVDLWRPVGVAAARRGEVYVTDAGGRISLFSPDGTSRVIAGATPGFADGAGAGARFNNPTGLAVDVFGIVRVADSDNYLVRALAPPGAAPPSHDIFLSALPLLSPDALGFTHVPWPVDPQEGWHEVAATLGEARGSFGGDGRERLHAGLDVQAARGTLVRAVHDEKVARPIASSGYGELNEMVRASLVAYVHVRAGRDAGDKSLDPGRFQVLYDEDGRPVRVRVRRGTRFHVGDPVGTVNRFAHVHLGMGPQAAEVNLLRFALAEFSDRVPPTIPANGISLWDEWGKAFPVRQGRVEVSGRAAIVASAWDRVDGNKPRRRLGVYSLGYQVLRRDGTPASGFEQPRTTITFDRMPQTPGAGRFAYAEGSGITVYGNRATRFLYIVTNEVSGGDARQGWWDTTALDPGDYRLRVIAKDISGNSATREVQVRVGR